MTYRQRAIAVAAIWVSTLTGSSAWQDSAPNLLTAGIAEIQAAVDSGALTYEALVQQYWRARRLRKSHGRMCEAVRDVNPPRLSIARRFYEIGGKAAAVAPAGISMRSGHIDTVTCRHSGRSRASFPPRDACPIELLRPGPIIFIKTLSTNLPRAAWIELAWWADRYPFENLKRIPWVDRVRRRGRSVFATAGLATETPLSIRGPAANPARRD